MFVDNDPNKEFKNYYTNDKKWESVVSDVHKFILKEKKEKAG